MSSLQKWASPINKSCKVNEDDVLSEACFIFVGVLDDRSARKYC
jgi:hypothetical protein